MAGLSFVLALCMPVMERAQGAPTERPSDEMVVYCLIDERRVRLVEAAILLGSARTGSTPERLHLAGGAVIDVRSWPVVSPDSFGRACEALRSAEYPPPGSRPQAGAAPSITPVLISGTTGVLLTFMLMEWRLARDRRRATADRLRAGGVRFRRAVGVIVNQRLTAVTVHPDAVACLAHRDDLSSDVAKVLLDEPGSSIGPRVLKMLADATMIDALTTARAQSSAQRQATMRALTDWALSVEVAVEQLARAVEKAFPTRLRTNGGVADR
ncbi:hypothetical protein [Actinoplanes sp. NPDC049265]|uniref:hypothetical protein n=1 Tax=Actinoplanes sp. NPDC049265 TaxID=3363902 RepID=UPI0037244B68